MEKFADQLIGAFAHFSAREYLFGRIQ